jgi:hypothetical protein
VGEQYGVVYGIIYELKNGNRKVKEYDYNRRLIFQGEFSYTIFLKNIFF